MYYFLIFFFFSIDVFQQEGKVDIQSKQGEIFQKNEKLETKLTKRLQGRNTCHLE